VTPILSVLSATNIHFSSSLERATLSAIAIRAIAVADERRFGIDDSQSFGRGQSFLHLRADGLFAPPFLSIFPSGFALIQ